jgi:hypothetical protein
MVSKPTAVATASTFGPGSASSAIAFKSLLWRRYLRQDMPVSARKARRMDRSAAFTASHTSLSAMRSRWASVNCIAALTSGSFEVGRLSGISWSSDLVIRYARASKKVSASGALRSRPMGQHRA